ASRAPEDATGDGCWAGGPALARPVRRAVRPGAGRRAALPARTAPWRRQPADLRPRRRRAAALCRLAHPALRAGRRRPVLLLARPPAGPPLGLPAGEHGALLDLRHRRWPGPARPPREPRRQPEPFREGEVGIRAGGAGIGEGPAGA